MRTRRDSGAVARALTQAFDLRETAREHRARARECEARARQQEANAREARRIERERSAGRAA